MPIPTNTLRSAPRGLSKAWNHVHRRLVGPINLILVLKEKLVNDNKYNAPAYRVWNGQLATYEGLLSKARLLLSGSLEDLRLIAPNVYSVGHEILAATLPVQTALASVAKLSRAQFKGTSQEHHNAVLDFRNRVLQACDQFSDRDLLEQIELGIRDEWKTRIEVEWENDRVTGADYRIGVAAETDATNGTPALKTYAPTATSKENENDPRDKFAYKSLKARKSLQWIKNKINARKKWDPLESVQAVSAAAKRYALRQRPPLPWPIFQR